MLIGTLRALENKEFFNIQLPVIVIFRLFNYLTYKRSWDKHQAKPEHSSSLYQQQQQHASENLSTQQRVQQQNSPPSHQYNFKKRILLNVSEGRCNKEDSCNHNQASPLCSRDFPQQYDRDLAQNYP